MPVANQFRPQLILVSCGFDAAAGDQNITILGGDYNCGLLPATYAHMTRSLMNVAENGKVVVILEVGTCDKRLTLLIVPCSKLSIQGGYLIPNIVEGTMAIIKALLNEPITSHHRPPIGVNACIQETCWRITQYLSDSDVYYKSHSLALMKAWSQARELLMYDDIVYDYVETKGMGRFAKRGNQ